MVKKSVSQNIIDNMKNNLLNKAKDSIKVYPPKPGSAPRITNPQSEKAPSSNPAPSQDVQR